MKRLREEDISKAEGDLDRIEKTLQIERQRLKLERVQLKRQEALLTMFGENIYQRLFVVEDAPLASMDSKSVDALCTLLKEWKGKTMVSKKIVHGQTTPEPGDYVHHPIRYLEITYDDSSIEEIHF